MRTRTVLKHTAGLVAGVAAFSAAWRQASRMDLRGRTALITGGSRGLGLAIARELGRLGAHVTLAARDAAELDAAREDLESRGIGVSVLVCDLAERGEGRRIVEQVIADRGRLDVLVNNAGVIQVGPLEHMHTADFEEAMDIHFWAPLQTMTAAVPAMKAQGGGRIVNISSIGGKVGVAHLVPYCASKFALTGLSESMRGELVKDNILVTTVAPGLMRTGSPFNAWFKGNHREEFAWFTVSDSLPLMTIDAARAPRQSANPRPPRRASDRQRLPLRRRPADRDLAGQAGDRRQRRVSVGGRAGHVVDQPAAAETAGRVGRPRPQRLAAPVARGPVPPSAAPR